MAAHMAVQIEFDPKQAAAIGFVWELLVALLIPIVLCAVAGRALDRYFETSPWLMVASIPVAMTLSYKMIRDKAEQLGREMYPSKTGASQDHSTPSS